MGCDLRARLRARFARACLEGTARGAAVSYPIPVRGTRAVVRVPVLVDWELVSSRMAVTIARHCPATHPGSAHLMPNVAIGAKTRILVVRCAAGFEIRLICLLSQEYLSITHLYPIHGCHSEAPPAAGPNPGSTQPQTLWFPRRRKVMRLRRHMLPCCFPHRSRCRAFRASA